MLRRTKDLLNAAGLYRLTAIHHQHPIGDIGHDAHIVGDKDHPHRHLLLQDGNELQNLRLDGDIQRRGWLIGYQHRRPTGERHGDHHPLAHAAGELVRIAREHLFRLGNTHLIEHLFRRAQRLFAPQPLVQAQGFGNLLADGKNRIQRGHRLLKNHGQIRAAHPAHLGVRLLIERDHLPVTPPQPQPLAAHFAAGGVKQTHQRQRGHRFSRTGLTHYRQRLAAAQAEGKLTHGLHLRRILLAERHVQVAHHQHFAGIGFVSLRHSPSPLFYSR